MKIVNNLSTDVSYKAMCLFCAGAAQTSKYNASHIVDIQVEFHGAIAC